ncbi:hypothetical protein [Agromyces sp. NPDC058064]|uniref:hypothetical protein n=1 Tax=Agromyces sp. NPDC058064 TaxID=3346322 RepID=UPI0036DB9636
MDELNLSYSDNRKPCEGLIERTWIRYHSPQPARIAFQHPAIPQPFIEGVVARFFASDPLVT